MKFEMAFINVLRRTTHLNSRYRTLPVLAPFSAIRRRRLVVPSKLKSKFLQSSMLGRTQHYLSRLSQVFSSHSTLCFSCVFISFDRELKKRAEIAKNSDFFNGTV